MIVVVEVVYSFLLPLNGRTKAIIMFSLGKVMTGDSSHDLMLHGEEKVLIDCSSKHFSSGKKF